jgi:uncharacterized protein (UPF0262 family)
MDEFIKTLKLAPSLIRLKSSHEANTAINDLLDFNYFSVLGSNGESVRGPYHILLDEADNKLILDIKSHSEKVKLPISVRPFKSMVKDYFLLFGSYQDAMRVGHPEKIEALDMGRRSIHNEGAEKFINILENRINIDFETARRFFTIISALMMKEGDNI